MLTKVIWTGNKTTMDGEFVVAATGKLVAVGAYANGNYEVVFNDGAISTFRNAAQALAGVNRMWGAADNG